MVKIKIHLHVHSHMLLLLRKYASTYIHSFPSPDSPKSILLLIRERIAKIFSYTCEINAPVILVTTTCYIISGDECSKKRRERKKIIIIRGNKKGQEPGTSKKKEKSETRGKNGQVSGVELGVLLMQKRICKHKGLIPDLNVKACQPI